MFADPRAPSSRVLVAYFGVFQVVHLALNARYQFLPFSARPPLPFAAPPEGWSLQLVQFTSGMAVADLINAALSLVFVYGYFRDAPWCVWLGTVTLTVAAYAAFAFSWGATMAGAPALGWSYAWMNGPTIPVLGLFVAWSYWVLTKRLQ